MANPEHLAILKRGAVEWNKWRRIRQFVFVERTTFDLSDDNLKNEDLGRADLSGTNLTGARLMHADLTGANLHGADLKHADLSGARLIGALLGAGAVIEDREPFGYRAQIFGSSLQGANFTGTSMGATNFSAVDLSSATGLAEVKHITYSSLGVDALYASRGKIPEIFLRGCGVPDNLIQLQKSLIASGAWEYYSCFISYSHEDKPFASRLHDQLQGKGIRCWLDEAKLKIGEEILKGVLDAIRINDRVVLCCSESSLTSEWVETELEETFEKEDKEGRPILLPLDLDGYLFKGWKGPKAVKVRKRLAANFTGWERDNAKFEAQFERVVQALRSDDQARQPPPTSKL